MLSNVASLSSTDAAVPGVVTQPSGSIGSVVNGIVHEVDVVDLVEIVCIPFFLYVVHGLIEMVKNHIEPGRGLLRPRDTRR